MIKAIVFDFFGVLYFGQINNDLLEYAGELKKNYKTAILSNVFNLPEYFDPKISEQYFDAIGASDEIGYAKPEHKAYRHVLDALGVEPEESVMIDDSPMHIAAAKDLGMHGIVYQNLSQLKKELELLLNARAA